MKILKTSQKNGLKIDEKKTHQILPNLKFCLSPSKEKKTLFVLKQFSFIFKDIFLFCTASFFLNLQLELKLVSCNLISNLVFSLDLRRFFNYCHKQTNEF